MTENYTSTYVKKLGITKWDKIVEDSETYGMNN